MRISDSTASPKGDDVFHDSKEFNDLIEKTQKYWIAFACTRGFEPNQRLHVDLEK